MLSLLESEQSSFSAFVDFGSPFEEIIFSAQS
jgi:hypothetical protein